MKVINDLMNILLTSFKTVSECVQVDYVMARFVAVRVLPNHCLLA